MDGGDVEQVVRDIHKTLQAIVEEDLTKDLFDEAFLISRLSNLLKPTSEGTLPLQKSTKLPKVLRMITILMIQSNCEACNRDLVQSKLLNLVQLVIQYYKHLQPTPFDQINLCLDGILLKPSPASVGLLLDNDHMLANKLLNTTMDICDDILKLLNEHSEKNQQDSASFEVWFKVLKTLQSKILLSPYTSLYTNV